MAKPANYDETSLVVHVNPDQLWVQGNIIPAYVANVSNSLKSISTTIEGLKLGWAGNTASEATQFLDRWNVVMVRLFGPADPNAKIGPNDAVLSKIGFAVQLASSNYGNAEDQVTNMFDGFLGSGGATTGSSRDLNEGPIREHNTPKSEGH